MLIYDCNIGALASSELELMGHSQSVVFKRHTMHWSSAGQKKQHYMYRYHEITAILVFIQTNF